MESTIPMQIATGKSYNISNERLHSHKVLSCFNSKMVINYLSILSNYQRALESKITTIELNPDQFRKYRYKPKTLSYDLYGTIELATALLRINGCVSISEFNKAKIKVFTLSIMDDLLEIMNKEKDHISSDHQEIIDGIKEPINE